MKAKYHKTKEPEKIFLAPHLSKHIVLTNYNFIILPICDVEGLDPRDLSHGDVLRFIDGKEKHVYDICLIRMDTSLFRNLCRLKYGVEPSIIKHRWERMIISLGYTSWVINDREAVVVWFKRQEDKDFILGVKGVKPEKPEENVTT